MNVATTAKNSLSRPQELTRTLAVGAGEGRGEGMPGFLQTMRRLTESRVNESINNSPSLHKNLEHTRTPHPFLDIFQTNPAIIAEIKFGSPTLGKIHQTHDPIAIANQYLQNGANALSILTEPTYFHGSLDYLQQIRAVHPEARLLMKDFIMSEHQLLQARTYGADAVLLIVAFLSQTELHDLYHFAISLGLTPLIEVHTQEELKQAEGLGAKLIGINNRNLNTLAIDLNTSIEMIEHARSNAILISESGIKSSTDMLNLNKIGYRGFLIGSHFMQHEHPGLGLRQLLNEVTNAH